ncbi:uncharacterized protein [Sinocyclocheilus grahami]|uniref:uncharacterized protein n=1 Tax=Sinocyclocheilus grahami TaxID=75366 RepID=UPI0007AD637D|nr:PREDICTED: uncharacterized protein LOC107561407 [Sinocyclocheilus grahami]
MRFLISLCASQLLLINVAFSSNDPCYNYESLDHTWRATDEAGFYVCDEYFDWNGWYRLFYNGMDIRMPERCVNAGNCNTDHSLWLNGSHPQIEDGEVIMEVCASTLYDCCYFESTPIRVKACPGDYYVYELVNPQYGCSGYCTDISTISQTSSTSTPSTFSGSSLSMSAIDTDYDPCHNYNILDEYWRSTLNYWYQYGYMSGNDDTLVEWHGWYRLFINGSSAQMPEWCFSYMSCGGYSSLWLGDPHPEIEEGVVTREVYGSVNDQCSYYISDPIQVKACPGNYYVYKLESPKPSIPVPVYCAVPFSTPNTDPCYDYTSLDDPWRATDNYYNNYVCDYNVNWNGWYRLFYYGQSVQMPDSCVGSGMCGTDKPLWLNGPHPQLEDGVVTRQVCGSTWNDCCDYKSHPIRVKACTGNYYVYEFVRPLLCSSYCADVSSLSSPTSTTSPTATVAVIPPESITPPVTDTALHFDPCYSYTVLDDPWRATDNRYTFNLMCDAYVSWVGWYRLFIHGQSVQMPDTCVDRLSCGTHAPLWLNGPHPRIEDGVVTRDVCGHWWNNCCGFQSNPIRVKACPDNYYVYEFVSPSFCYGTYCADVSNNSISIPTFTPETTLAEAFRIDPCYNYTALDDPWRATDNHNSYNCDASVNWDGWYRLFIAGQDAQMPETCVNQFSCGTVAPLWLNGQHPRVEDGVVTRHVCGHWNDDCCNYVFNPMKVKACPGNYYVYEFMNPVFCNVAYCSEVTNIRYTDVTPHTTPTGNLISYTSNPIQVKACPGNVYVYRLLRPKPSIPLPVYCAVLFNTPNTDPCYDYTSLDDPWRATDNYYNNYMCDYNVNWNGWYRLFYYGQSVQMPESSVGSDMCGTPHPLWLNGPHPELEDGMVTRQVCGSTWNDVCGYKSHPIQVKACPGNYYVYEFVRPTFCASYCADVTNLASTTTSETTVTIPPTEFSTLSVTTPAETIPFDPCYNYTVLDDSWRSTSNQHSSFIMCDAHVNWNGWYRLFIGGQSGQMPDTCVDQYRCSTHAPLWLNGQHPQVEDGVVTRNICGHWGNDCCYFQSNPIKVKACPGNYYVYEFVQPNFCSGTYCAAPTPSSDPCSGYNVLDDGWRDLRTNFYQSYYNDDRFVEWNGWYRLYLNGESAQLSEWCTSFTGCGGEVGLYLNGSHPKPEDGVVTREVLGSSSWAWWWWWWSAHHCGYYKSTSIEIKACPGDYYVYKLVKPNMSIPMPTYCAVAFNNISNDPCYNYENLDRPWRATNETGLYICDENFSWNGWYRLFYNGMDIRMQESCVADGSCNTYSSLWLNGPHPQIEDGVVTMEVCGGRYYSCCNFKSTPIRVKACPGDYYVYELVKPHSFYCSGYCTDASTISTTFSSTSPATFMGSSMTAINTDFDPCYDYNILDNSWRSTLNLWYQYAHDDTLVEWHGWYRLFIDGSSAQMPEWCFSYMLCGGYSSLWLGGPHPEIEDGVITREVYGSVNDQCSYYRSDPIQVKACPGNYYVYKIKRPNVLIPAPTYCAVAFTTPSADPCYNYNSLDEPQRATISPHYDKYYHYGICDYNYNWNGWYRLFYNGQSVQMPDSCVGSGMCGTPSPLWLNGPHPQLEDGVVTRQVCGSTWNDCCGHKSHPIQVKACPGNYYVYEFVRPTFCSAYCAEVNVPHTTTRSNISSGPFYPFGAGDTENDRSDDGISPVISLLQPFRFFGETYNQLYINNNGYLTFDWPWYSYFPYQFPGYGGEDLIAPFWTDIDNRGNGFISYRQYSSGSVLTEATQDINQYFTDLSFSATWVFVATWDRVAYYPYSGTETSFQVVLISDGHFSFVLFNYGTIAPTQRYVQAGYDTISSTYHFSITGSLQYNITSLTYSSNVNVPGRWVFRTDHGSQGCQFYGVPVQLEDSFWSDATCQQRCTCTSSGLQCSHEPCSYSQACRPAAFQYSCQNIQRQTCTISGDPHYYTFDYQVFHFQGTCTYVLSEACGNGLPYYRIEGKNEHRGSTHVSWTRMVRVFVYDEVIELVKDHYYEARVNGSFAATPFTLRNGSIQVYRSGFSLAISTDFGLLVTYDAYSYVSISVPYDYFNSTCGLCGNFNLHPEDDFCSPSGEILSSDVDFANSWKVQSDTDPECHNVRCTGLACAVCTTDEMTLYSDSNHCGILEDVVGPFADCHPMHAPQTYIENCVYDLCLGGGYQPILCQALNVYATQCQQQGVQLGQWRQQGFCEIQCPVHSHFEPQGTGCPATCSNPSAPMNCPLPSQESCICDPGYILSAGECVPEANCGCIFEGFYYAEGQSVVLDGDCGRQCVCSSMSMTCHQHQCGPAEVCGVHEGVRGCRPTGYATCSVEDLGSYHTFDGQSFRYSGACGLTLTRVMGPSLLPHFVLTVEKVPRGLQDFSRVLKFEAEGIQVTIEMGEGSNVKVDGQMVGLPISVGSGQIRIYHSSVRGFVLETNFGVTVRADWPHIVRITAPSTYSGTLGGLCGNLNGDIADEFYTPDAVLLNDTQLFADSWRDGSLSAHCEDPNDSWETGHYQNSSQFIEHCSIMAKHDGPFVECSRAIDPQQRIADCVQLLEQTQGAREALCEALRGYTLLCQQNGIAVEEWRIATHCDPSCPANSHYVVCGTSCPASCPSLSFPFQCALQCQEGCQCNDGNVLNGDRCVPPVGCGCYHSGRYRQAGETFWHGEECQFLCVCDGITGNVHCTPSSCSEVEVCHVLDGEYGCHPRPHARCSASGDPHYMSFDKSYFDFQGTCRYVLATVCNDTTGLPHFQVDARNEAWHGLPVSITVEIFVNVSGHLVHMSLDMNRQFTVEVDGETRNLPILLDSGRVSVYSSAQYIFVSTDFGLSVGYSGSWAVDIIVPADYGGVTCGICGNFNGQSNDDFMTPSGALVRSADQFGASWKVEDELPCNDGCGNHCPLCQDQTTSRSLCDIIRSREGPFSFCHVYVDPQAYFDDCVFDVCLSGNHNDVLCRSIQTYASACQSNNAVIYPWRESASCVITCPENSHYELCGTDCGHTCASNIDASCEHTCSEGCFCDDGLVRSGGLCVPVEQCGCLLNGFYFNVGNQFWNEECSQLCECFAPNDLRCSDSSCPSTMECTVRNGLRGCYDESPTYISTTRSSLPSEESTINMTTTGPIPPAVFYPFGAGDIVNDRSDDGSSSVIYFLHHFIFFGQTYSQIYVNNNGHLTFNGPFHSYTPYQFPGYGEIDLIAPFWIDIDNRGNGVISYRQYTSGSVLTEATQDINQYFPELSFSATWVFVATWDRVAYFPLSGTETSFQVVLISDGHYTFVLMNYGTIAPKVYVQAGYDTINSRYHFSIPGSFSNNITNLTYSSNVNVPGRWAFRTDHGSRGCQFNGIPVQLEDSFWSDATCQQRCTCTSSGLQCSHEPCSYSQACRPAAFQYSCQNIQRQTCTISGDPHYYTFDYQVFHFQGTCTYVLSEACGSSLPYYRIEGKNEHRGSTHVSWTRMVRVFVYDEVIELVKDHYYDARVNGSFAATPFTLRNGSIQVYRSGFSLAISTDFGLVVTYDAYSYVSISVPYDYFNSTCGLCGNFNLHPEDDFRSPSGEILSSDVDFANSWKVQSDTDPECHNVRCTGLACAVCTTDEMTLYSDSNHCGILEDVFGHFGACHSVHAPQTYIENCVYDLCLGGGYLPILCQALNVYATQCQQQGVQLGQWRQQGFCEIQCPVHSHFEPQGTGCLATCSNPSAPMNCPLPSQESCICDPGYILSAGECVPEANCGCIFESFYYAEGQSVVLDGDCGRQCVCSSMSMTCHQHQCGPAEVCGVHDGVRGCRPTGYATCSVEDLGSYHTFDGQSFRYPGACGLTLSRVMGPSSLPHFVLTVEKVPRGLQDFSRVLKFEAEGIQVSIEMGEGSNVKVDGQMVGLPVSVGSGQIRIYHSSVRGFVLETNFGVTVRADWPHIVRITAPSTYSGTLGGLCGNLNGDIADEFYTPDTVLLNDTQLFADSWRDGSLSAHCEDPNDSWETGHYQNSSQFIEHCSIMAKHDGPFVECSRAIDPQQRIADCVQLLEQTQGAREALCEALRGYTLLCQQNGIAVEEWRIATHCDPSCPANSHYVVCGTSCPASCPSLSFPFQCALQCQEGCQCNDGNVLNGDRCVPPVGCGCYHSGRYRQAGETFWHGEECQFLCVCDGITGNVHCTASSCSEVEVCHVLDGEYGCHPRPHARCSASGDPHYMSFDKSYFDFQGTCRYVLATVCNDTTGLPHFQVDARNEAWHGLPVSITVEIFVNVSGHLVHMSLDMNRQFTVEVDGETRNLPILLDSGRVSVYSSAQYIFVSTDFGLSVGYSGSWAVDIIVPADYGGVTCGICGNFNGQSNDDFMTPSGALVRSADQFGASWKVEDELPCNDGCGNHCPLCQDQTTSRSLCDIIRSSEGPFSFCHVYVDPQAYFDDCVFDVCLSGNRNDVLCRSIQTYASACQSNNAVIYPWRESAFCVITCPESSHHELCGTDCGHTCASNIDASCEHTCFEGCFCDDGLVRSGGLCVPVEQCGCLHTGFYFNVGEQFWDEECSQLCECFAPNDLRCSDSTCPSTMECTVRNGLRGCYEDSTTHFTTAKSSIHSDESTTHIITTTSSLPSEESTTYMTTTKSTIPSSEGDPCQELSCTENEWCEEKHGVYGCSCKENHHRSPHDSFDFIETCESSSGSMSLSRCQLFEAGFPSDILHLNDPNCRGTVQNGRVEFYFDNNDHICGTNLVANGTHFIYKNFIVGEPKLVGHLISRERILKLPFICVYSQTQTLSMDINPLESTVHMNLPAGQGTYQVRMIPYQDAEFSLPFAGSVNAELSKRIFVEVGVDGVDSRQFASVIDTCWATPVNDPHYPLRWDLIVDRGTYQVRMIPYQDAEFSHPFAGSVNAELSKRIFVEVGVDGVDSRQFASVIDTCWATPVNDPHYPLRWDLIVD